MIVTKIKDVATVVHGLLDVFDWDVYYPMENEGNYFNYLLDCLSYWADFLGESSLQISTKCSVSY